MIIDQPDPYTEFLRCKVKLSEILGIELSPSYFLDGIVHCRMAAEKMATPDLFALDTLAA